MASYASSFPALHECFPPTPKAYHFLFTIFRTLSVFFLLQWTPAANYTFMGKTSINSRFNLPGRYAWAIAESVGPLNLLFILFNLPPRLRPQPDFESSIIGTGLPAQQEILGFLYVIHYINRAGVTPLFLAPSMSPIHALISFFMSTFQFLNSSSIACWIVYSVLNSEATSKPLISLPSVIGLALYGVGLAGNILSENQLFQLRRAAAKRKAKSEGKAKITYDKVYVVPPAEGVYRYVMFPHYSLEWLEWTGFYILGGAWGLGWGFKSAALWFVIAEIMTMLPRAVSGKQWYENKFGKRAVAGRKAAIPFLI